MVHDGSELLKKCCCSTPTWIMLHAVDAPATRMVNLSSQMRPILNYECTKGLLQNKHLEFMQQQAVTLMWVVKE